MLDARALNERSLPRNLRAQYVSSVRTRARRGCIEFFIVPAKLISEV